MDQYGTGDSYSEVNHSTRTSGERHYLRTCYDGGIATSSVGAHYQTIRPKLFHCPSDALTTRVVPYIVHQGKRHPTEALPEIPDDDLTEVAVRILDGASTPEDDGCPCYLVYGQKATIKLFRRYQMMT
jgi:hypothetical protein